jgi:hypothetical protein
MPTKSKESVKIADRVDIIGHNVEHIREYVATRRPECLGSLDQIIEATKSPLRSQKDDALLFLLAIGYSAGRASVVAEVEGRTIKDVCEKSSF